MATESSPEYSKSFQLIPCGAEISDALRLLDSLQRTDAAIPIAICWRKLAQATHKIEVEGAATILFVLTLDTVEQDLAGDHVAFALPRHLSDDPIILAVCIYLVFEEAAAMNTIHRLSDAEPRRTLIPLLGAIRQKCRQNHRLPFYGKFLKGEPAASFPYDAACRHWVDIRKAAKREQSKLEQTALGDIWAELVATHQRNDGRGRLISLNAIEIVEHPPQ